MTSIVKTINNEDLLKKICDANELREIKKTRKKYEAQITKNNEKHACLSYIAYEVTVWEKITAKNTHVNISNYTGQIVILYKSSLITYKDDVHVWLSFIKFCINADYTKHLSRTFAEMLRHHTNENLWLLAAKWELDELENLPNALSYLYSGLSHHPKSQALYSKLFELQLESSNCLHSEDDDNKQSKLFKDIQKHIPVGVEFYLELLKIAFKYPLATGTHIDVVKYIRSNFGKHEEFWDLMAKRELQGNHLTKDYAIVHLNDSDQSVLLENMAKKYDFAVQEIKTESMWFKYLTTLLELQQNAQYSNHTKYLTDLFLTACLNAHKAKLLPEDIYLKWIELLEERKKDKKEIIKILDEATQQKSNCISLWISLVRCFIKNSPKMIEEVDKVFAKAIETLKEDSIQIWRLKIQFYQVNFKSDAPQIETVFRDGIKYSKKIAKLLKPQFFDWLILFKSSDAAWEYKQLAKEEPWCFEIHKKMAEFEAMCPQPSKETFDLISDLACKQFGRDMWMNYVREEVNCGPYWKQGVYKNYLLNS